MTKSQQLTVRMSEIRQKLNELLGVEERSAEQSTEIETLTAEAQKLEPELRAAIVAEGSTETRTVEVDAEHRERLELRGRSHLGAFLLAALQGREVAGAELEYRQALGFQHGIPIDIFEQDRPADEEHRAATPAPATGTGVTVAPVQPFVFAPSIAARLGIDMPQVGSGGYTEMTITTALPAAPKNKGDDADDTAAALTPVSAKARRISARMTVAIEDVANVGTDSFEAALRQNVSGSLSAVYDNQCINGDGVAPNIDGLINQLDNPTDPTAVVDFDAFVKAFSDQIDGLWASTMREVGMCGNVDTYRLSARTFRDRVIDTGQRGGVSLGDVSAADYLAMKTGGWWTNKRMPATAANIARAIVYRMGRMGLRTACHPTWGTVSVDDVYTSSRSGQRHFTVHALVGDKVLIVQPDAYALAEFKVS